MFKQLIITNQSQFKKKQSIIMKSKNQIKKSIEGNYFSTYAFVNGNNLEDVAEIVLGKGWSAEDDCSQIQAIIDHLNIGKYNVNCYVDDIIVEEEIN